MKVSEIMVRDVISVSPADTAAKALQLMAEMHIHQLPVADDGLLLGMISLKDALSTTSPYVSAATTKTPTLKETDTIETAIEKMIQSSMRALPVVDGNTVRGIVSETELINNIRFLDEVDAEHFATRVAVVGENDGLDKALSMMKQQNVSRIIVANGKVLGCVDNLSMAAFLSKPSQSVRLSATTGIEKESLASFKVHDFIRQTCVMDRKEFSLKKAISRLQQFEEIVLYDKGVYGIVTPKDILELGDYKEMPVQVANLTIVPSMEIDVINDELSDFAEKAEKVVNVQRMFVYFDSNSKGGRVHYFVRAKMITRSKVLTAQADGWTANATVHDMIEVLRKQLMKFHDRAIKRKRIVSRKIKQS